jgi:ElaB/YqjD/DUF883 family membrane-anchored ribosome-binding protein
MGSKPKNFQQALDELEDLATSHGTDLKSRLQRELEELEAKIRHLKPQVEDLKDKVNEEVHKAKDKMEEQVKDHPWTALGLVALVFFILGILLSRRSD